jgi:hypothetical protein
MTLAQYPEVTKLPKRQRMKLAEALWFSGVDDRLPVTSLHKEILDERWSAYQAGTARRISLAELERRLKQK